MEFPVIGAEHGLVLVPSLTLRHKFLFGKHLAVGGHQLHAPLFLLAVDIAHPEREIVGAAALTVGDAVPSFVDEGVGLHHGIMGVVGTQGMGGIYLYRSQGVPGSGGAPLLAVARGVFEIAVLNQLGIQTAVGGITDVFEEHTDEFVADGLALAAVDGEGGADGLEVFHVGGIVGHTLGTHLAVETHHFMVGEQLDEFALGDVENLAFVEAAVDGGGVAAPCHVADAALLGLGEVAEVFVTLQVVFLIAGDIEDVEGLVVAFKHDGFQTVLRRQTGVVLRTPHDEVFAVGGSKTGGVVVHLPDGTPGAVGGAEHAG